jgi:hypothetical protein
MSLSDTEHFLPVVANAITMKTEKQKMQKISFRIGEKESQILSTMCKQSRQKRSAVIRELIAKGTVKQRLSPEQLKQITGLMGMANNLNQLTKKLHVLGQTELSQTAGELKEVLNNILNQINQP